MKIFTPEDDASLREALKRCSAPTYEAARQFRETGDIGHLPVIVHGVIERYVKRDLHDRFQRAPDDLLLSAHLGVDSLTMMEIVLLAEDVLQISIHNEDLRPLRTLGDVQQFVECRVRGIPWARPAKRPAEKSHSGAGIALGHGSVGKL